MRFIALSVLIVLLTPLCLSAGVEEEWGYIVSLDAGPKKRPTTRDEAALVARNHLLVQRKAIEQFLLRYPGDQRAFDAKLRLARIMAAEGKMGNDQGKVDDALRLLAELEKSSGVPREKLADAGFARASLSMQNQKDNGRAGCGNPSYGRQKISPRSILVIDAARACSWKRRQYATMFPIKSGIFSKRPSA